MQGQVFSFKLLHIFICQIYVILLKCFAGRIWNDFSSSQCCLTSEEKMKYICQADQQTDRAHFDHSLEKIGKTFLTVIYLAPEYHSKIYHCIPLKLGMGGCFLNKPLKCTLYKHSCNSTAWGVVFSCFICKNKKYLGKRKQ